MYQVNSNLILDAKSPISIGTFTKVYFPPFFYEREPDIYSA